MPHPRHRTRGLASIAVAALALSLVAAAPASSAPQDSPAAPQADSEPAASGPAFERTATYPVFRNVPDGVDPSEATVAEISAVSEDGRTVISTDAAGHRIGFVDISDPGNPVGRGTLDLSELGDAEDEPTSVAVVGDYVLVVVNTSASYTDPSGRLDVIRLSDRERVRSIPLGGQPDSIAVSPDKAHAAIAIENERDEEATPDGGEEGDLPQAPPGALTVLDLDGAPADWAKHDVPLTNPDGSALPVLADAGLDTPTDPEPEYVDINGRNQLALTLQENNGIVLVDLAGREIIRAFSAGEATAEGVDTENDGLFDATGSVTAPREPDAVHWVDDQHLATANEGDWKGGSRGWTVFRADGSVAWDAGNTFEQIATAVGLHNEDRADNKGAEPEGLTVATLRGTRYAFVGSERSNFVAVYDVDDPARPVFRQVLPTTNGPEGLIAVPQRDLFVVSSEEDDAEAGVRATVGVYRLGNRGTSFPSIRSDYDEPIGWGALSALAGRSDRPRLLWATSDAAYATGRIYTIRHGRTPARITGVTTVTRNGSPVQLDLEGLHAMRDGSFWAVSEGATGAENQLLRINADGSIRRTVRLPKRITDRVGKWGLEGVTVAGRGARQRVYVALQRPLFTNPDDPSAGGPDAANVVRIGQFDPRRGNWHWLGYRLGRTATDGDWMGLSEITAIDGDSLAVIERDKLNGPAARVKKVYAFDIPRTSGDLTMVRKRQAVDVLPRLRSLDGWTQEKLEGLGIAGNGQVYAVTDNDGLEDATGETNLLGLGTARRAFGPWVGSRTTVRVRPQVTRNGVRVRAVVRTSDGRLARSGRIRVLLDGRLVRRADAGRAVFTFRRLERGRHRVRVQFTGSRWLRPSRDVARFRVTR